MMKINFNLDKPQKSDSYIIAVIRYLGRKTRISMYSLGCPKIKCKNWNPSKQRAKGEGAAVIKSYLDKFVRISNDVFHRMNLESGMPDTVALKENIKEEYTGIRKKESISFNQFTTQYLERVKKEKAYNTFRTYRSDVQTVLDYQKIKKREFDFKDMDLKWCVDFKMHLLSTGMNPNTCHKKIRNIRKILKEAYRLGINKYIYYKDDDFRGNKIKVKDQIVLTLDELDLIYQTAFSGRLDNARDLFLIACYTGLRISDFSRILKENIYEEKGKLYLTIRTMKTKDNMHIPINPVIKSILDKRNGDTPRPISDQKFNDYIKEIAMKAGVDSKVQINEFVDGKMETNTYLKYEKLTSRVARRSFATNATLAGIPHRLAMEMTGHESIDSFESYINIGRKQAANLLSEHEFFNMPLKGKK